MNTLERPFFIVGSGRSGTTLLRAMLNATGAVHVPPESFFLAGGFRFWGSRCDLGGSDYLTIAEFFRRTSLNNLWEMSLETLHAALQEAQPRTFAAVADVLHRTYLQSHGLGEVQWGIKQPGPMFIAGLGEILRTFPQARILYLVRDGRDVYLSYQRVHKGDVVPFGPQTVTQNALYWVDGLRGIQEWHDERFLEVRYENLIADPAVVGSRISAHLNIPYEENAWTAHHQSSRLPSPGVGNQAILSEKATQQIDANNTQRWRTYMNWRERLLFEIFAGPCLDRYGYPREFKGFDAAPTNLFRALAYRAARRVNDARYRRRSLRAMKNTKACLSGEEVVWRQP